MRLHLLISLSLAICIPAMSQTNQPPKANPAEVMQLLRMKMLTNSPAELGQKASPEYPRVCGILMDWPLDNATVSVVSLSTGDASIYTTGTFGVIGGIGHESVLKAATNFVKLADKHYGEAKSTTDYSLPKANRVRFYLVCYDGVRMIEDDLNTVTSRKSKYSGLFDEGQRVITELRLLGMMDEPPKSSPK